MYVRLRFSAHISYRRAKSLKSDRLLTMDGGTDFAGVSTVSVAKLRQSS